MQLCAFSRPLRLHGMMRKAATTHPTAFAVYPGDSEHFQVEREEVLHDRYLTLYNRTVRFPESSQHKGQVFDYDIIGHPRGRFHFTVIFPFHPDPNPELHKVTILQEYCQGPNLMMYNLPSGGFDPAKHKDYEACARAELSEEAELAGGSMHSLIPSEQPGIPEVKWSANRFTPFLVVGSESVADPGKRDDEELIHVERVTVSELRNIMSSGQMLLPALTTCYMALDKLRLMNYELP